MSTAPRVHDLTATLRTHMPVWPTAPLPVIEPIGIIARDGYSLERLNCVTHTGTHLDAPYHFLEAGRTVDQILPGELTGIGAVLDLRKEVNGTLLPQEAIERHWPASFHPEIVLLETGWSHERAATKRYLYDFPGITPATAEWLVQRKVKGVGTDTLSIDAFANSKFEAHKILLGRDIWLLEALDHLDQLREGTPYTIVAAPLKLEGASGAMSRVFAIEA
ncbi:MAG: cyclase family protein [Thermoplasmata archaeon]|nr:cyclase family protein [Thermoplasmata archaeon]